MGTRWGYRSASRVLSAHAPHVSVAGDAAASGAALANKLAPCARRAATPTASAAYGLCGGAVRAPVPAGVRAPVTQHPASPAGDPRVRAPAVAGACLALVRAALLAPLPCPDVGSPQALLAHVTGVLLANRETLVRTQEAFAAAIALHDGSLVASRLFLRPSGPGHSAAVRTPAASCGSSTADRHAMYTYTIFL